MPYKSKAQQGYFNANKKKLEKQGVDVNEWNKASRGKKLPRKIAAKKPMARNRMHKSSLAYKYPARKHPST